MEADGQAACRSMDPGDWTRVQVRRGKHFNKEGASVVDVAQILKRLEEMQLFEVEHAVFVDGGSAMKAYAIDSDNAAVRLDLLNRVAAGSRNGPGSDPDGLNLYTLLRLGLVA